MPVAFFSLLFTMPLVAQADAYSYDNQGRLTQVIYADNSSINYSYDNMGNRTQAVTTLVTNNTASANKKSGGGSLLWMLPIMGLMAIGVVLARCGRHSDEKI